MRIPFLISLALCETGLAQSTVGDQASLPEMAKAVRPSVMLVRVYDEDGNAVTVATGFLVSADGKLVTNHHVIKRAARITVRSANGGEFQVEGILGEDAPNDLAVLKIDGRDLPFLKLAGEPVVEVGTRVFVIGNPLGLAGTLSEGIVSAIRNEDSSRKRLQITAAISSGSSGSPVLNGKEEVIAVAASAMSGGQALNFAIPAESVTALVSQIESDEGSLRRAKPFPFAKKRPWRNSIDPQIEIQAVPPYADYFEATKIKNWTVALKSAKAILARSPQDPIAYYLLATALENISFNDEALEVVNDGLKIDSSEPLLWFELGSIRGYRQKRYAEAATAYRKAIGLNPNFRAAWTFLGLSLISEEKGWEAVQAMRAALNLKSDEANGWVNLGSAYSSAGMSSEALAAYKKAIEIDPKYVWAWTRLAGEQAKSEDYQRAEVSYRKALEADPNDYSALHGLVELYWKLGQRAKFDEIAPSYRRVAPRAIPWLESLPWDKPVGRGQTNR